MSICVFPYALPRGFCARPLRLPGSGLRTISGMAVSIAEYNRRVNIWMNEHWREGRPCPLCGKSAGWELAPPVELPIRSADLEGQAAGTVIPMVPLMCRDCAYVVFLSAVAIGALVPRDSEPGGSAG